VVQQLQGLAVDLQPLGVSNAWYICYEYLEDIRKTMPQATTLQGLTPADAVIGQYVYTVSHELGHALFDVLDIPLLGQPEDAATSLLPT
jgi:hypothetical protein